MSSFAPRTLFERTSNLMFTRSACTRFSFARNAVSRVTVGVESRCCTAVFAIDTIEQYTAPNSPMIVECETR